MQSPSSMAAFRSAAALRYQSFLRVLEVRYLGPRIGAVDPLLSFVICQQMPAVQRLLPFGLGSRL